MRLSNGPGEKPDVSQPTCSNCGSKCDFQVVDFGVGRGEFWGQPYNDIELEWVSSCCEAPVIELTEYVKEHAEADVGPDGKFFATVPDLYDGTPDSDWNQIGHGEDEDEAIEALAAEFEDKETW